MNNYIPIPSAILIANMYAKRMSMETIDSYIKSTRKWINELTLDLDTLNYSKLLEQKVQLVKPKWYENKWIYFTYGVLMTATSVRLAGQIVD